MFLTRLKNHCIGREFQNKIAPMGTKIIFPIPPGACPSVAIFFPAKNPFETINLKTYSRVKSKIPKGSKVRYFHKITKYTMAISNWEIPQMANMKMIESAAGFG